MSADRFRAWKDLVARTQPCGRMGRLKASVGSILQGTLPGARLGELVLVGPQRRPAEVLGFRDDQVILLPASSQQGLRCGDAVIGTGAPMRIAWSEECVGTVVDPQGRRLDGGRSPRSRILRSLNASAPDPLRRRPIQKALTTAVRAIDGLLTLGVGQRIGLFAGPGVGKSVLLGQIARNAEVDRVVICLVGERGRELNEFLHQSLGARGRDRSVVVCATSDAAAGERARALPAALAMAEGFREAGHSVLLLVDSLTRHARAAREVALGAGEPPGRRGFPPSVFDRLASLVERTGNDDQGAITAVFTVLVEGELEEDPVAEEVRGLLDGHIVLDPNLARSGCFPAIDPCRSLSRLMDVLVDPEQRQAAGVVKSLWAAYQDRRDLIAVGAYQAGSEPLTDRAIALKDQLLGFVRQDFSAPYRLEETRLRLLELGRAGQLESTGAEPGAESCNPRSRS